MQIQKTFREISSWLDELNFRTRAALDEEGIWPRVEIAEAANLIDERLANDNFTLTGGEKPRSLARRHAAHLKNLVQDESEKAGRYAVLHLAALAQFFFLLDGIELRKRQEGHSLARFLAAGARPG